MEIGKGPIGFGAAWGASHAHDFAYNCIATTLIHENQSARSRHQTPGNAISHFTRRALVPNQIMGTFL